MAKLSFCLPPGYICKALNIHRSSSQFRLPSISTSSRLARLPHLASGRIADNLFISQDHFESPTMPGKVTSENGDSGGLTATEARFLKALFENMNTKPDADWDQVAHAMELKDSKCAKERFRQICKRHDWNGGTNSPKKPDAANPSGDGKVTKKRAPARKRESKVKSEPVIKAHESESSEDADEMDQDPAVKAEATEQDAEVVKEEEVENLESSGQI